MDNLAGAVLLGGLEEGCVAGEGLAAFAETFFGEGGVAVFAGSVH